MIEILRPDICVIGAGASGLTVAAAAASFGVSVVLIEQGLMGGDCLNYGCVPSKALLAAAKHAQSVREAARFGISAGEPQINFTTVRDHIRDVIAAIEPNDSVERFTGLGVRVIEAEAHFKDKRSVIAGAYDVRARRFVIATGSRPFIPPIEGLDNVSYVTNETVFDLPRRPTHLVIIGGGPIGMEMAQAFHRLGTKVTVVEAGRALAKDDPEIAALLVGSLRAEGIEIRENAKVERIVKRGRGGIRIVLAGQGERADERAGEEGAGSQEEAIEGSHLLVATGRAAHVDGLGLDKARIAYDRRGIKVNSRLRTRNRRVYAIGDATGGFQFTHWGGYQAGLVLRSILFRFGGRMDNSLIPWVTYTDPELAHVGLTEEEAVKRHGKIAILRWPFSENDRAQTERSTRGLVKVLATRRGRILGVDILGRGAGELIAPWALAIGNGLTVSAMATAVFPYPTMSEASKRAAVSFYAAKTQAPMVRRLIRFLRAFG